MKNDFILIPSTLYILWCRLPPVEFPIINPEYPAGGGGIPLALPRGGGFLRTPFDKEVGGFQIIM